MANFSQIILSPTLDESNSNRFMQCMESYFSKQLDCILPWTLNKNNQEHHSLNVCKGTDKFKKFRKITQNILKPEGNKGLIKGGCFVPKCRKRIWDIRYKDKEQQTTAGFRFYMPQNTKVLFRKEVRLYTLLNFFAEVGGYLGLLLGESLLSYIIAASKWMLIFARKLKAKCNKVDESSPT